VQNLFEYDEKKKWIPVLCKFLGALNEKFHSEDTFWWIVKCMMFGFKKCKDIWHLLKECHDSDERFALYKRAQSNSDKSLCQYYVGHCPLSEVCLIWLKFQLSCPLSEVYLIWLKFQELSLLLSSWDQLSLYWQICVIFIF
jgi:hypothetical protein